MIKYTSDNIFDSKMETIVNPVNCVGVMGKGLALEFKKRYPALFIAYKSACDRHLIKPGRVYISNQPDRKIMLFPTKDHWRNPSSYEYIEEGLGYFAEHYKALKMTSCAFPRIGCGCGGLEWSKVKALIVKYLSHLDIEIEIYE